MSAELFLGKIISESANYFSAYPKGITYSQFKICKDQSCYEIVMEKQEILPEEESQIQELFNAIDGIKYSIIFILF